MGIKIAMVDGIVGPDPEFKWRRTLNHHPAATPQHVDVGGIQYIAKVD